MEIAGADPEVIESLLNADGAEAIDALSVRALRDRIRELESSHTELEVQLETAENEAKTLQKQIKRGLPDRDDQLPHMVADLRAEIMALGKKAGLAIDSFNPLGAEVMNLIGSEAAHDYADGHAAPGAEPVAAHPPAGGWPGDQVPEGGAGR